MNELSRSRYLQAMGIDSYVSRRQLPGAAPTHRLVIVPTAAPIEPPDTPPAAAPASAPAAMPRLNVLDKPRVAPEPGPARAAANEVAAPAVKFSLAAIFCGGVAWVESLPDAILAREQVQLVRAMALAVHGSAGDPRVAQFDWPMNNNPQLDQGLDAARAGLAAFLGRHIEQAKCRALVSLGEDASALVPADALGGTTHVATRSTREMLENPACKREVWAALQAVVLRV